MSRAPREAVLRKEALEVAAELLAFPDVVPYATPPVEVTCRQGCHEYIARQVAQRQNRILFIDPRTRQFGIAILRSGEATEARQYPFERTAVLTFLRSVDPLEPD